MRANIFDNHKLVGNRLFFGVFFWNLLESVCGVAVFVVQISDRHEPFVKFCLIENRAFSQSDF